MTHGHTRSKTPSRCARMVGDAKAAPVGAGNTRREPIPSAVTATTGGIGRMTHPTQTARH